jgi:hypothetical protein
MQSLNDDFMGIPLASYGGLVALSLLFEKTIYCVLFHTVAFSDVPLYVSLIRSCSLKKAEEHVACLFTGIGDMNHILQQQQVDVMKGREELGAEQYRGWVETDLISAYFESSVESMVNLSTELGKHLAITKGQLVAKQEEFNNIEVLLQESRADTESLRAKNTILSKFVDQLTEDNVNSQEEILKYRYALKEASLCSEKHKSDLHNLEQQMENLRVGHVIQLFSSWIYENGELN